jgi:hypothetical protein
VVRAAIGVRSCLIDPLVSIRSSDGGIRRNGSG